MGKVWNMCRAYMFDFMFTMPAKLSVCLPVATTVIVIPYCGHVHVFSSALQGVV